MIGLDIKNILSEVYATVIAMGDEYINGIPSEKWNAIVANKNDRYNPYEDQNKLLEEQNLMDETYTFIASPHLDHWCDSEEEREQLVTLINENEVKMQKKLSECKSIQERHRLLSE